MEHSSEKKQEIRIVPGNNIYRIGDLRFHTWKSNYLYYFDSPLLFELDLVEYLNDLVHTKQIA